MVLGEVITNLFSALFNNLPKDNLFYFSIIFIVASILAYFAKLIKQPLIIAYIFTGVLLSHMLTGYSLETMRFFSELGIAFLLFLVGIELNFKDIKNFGKTSIIAGISQIILTFAIGFVILKLFQVSTIQAIYLALALTMSSTIIVIKLLSEKKDLESLYGKISIGILLVQDFMVIAVLILLSTIEQGTSISRLITLVVLKAIALLSFVYLLSKYVLRRIFHKIARSQELLFLSSATMPFLFILFSQLLGFSIEIGAFLAGLSLANLPYRSEITNKIKPLREFFLTIFFIILGTQFIVRSSEVILPAIILSLFVLILKPFIVMALIGILGYTKRTSLYTGLAVAQVSEFSLILGFLGLKLGHLNEQTLSLITLVAIITILLSSYMVFYNDKIYRKLSPYLSFLERKKLKEETHKLKKQKYDVILFGGHKTGYNIIKSLKVSKKKFLAVDFNPDIIAKLKKQGIDVVYGDVSDQEFIRELLSLKPHIVISTIHDLEDNLEIMRIFKEYNPKGIIFITTKDL